MFSYFYKEFEMLKASRMILDKTKGKTPRTLL